jgi:hypothetical protein
MMRNTKTALIIVLALLLPVVAVTAGSEIEYAVENMDSGTVRLSFAARDGVCGDGDECIFINDSRICWRCDKNDDDDWESDCQEGPVRVSLKVRNGEVVKLKTRVGGKWRRPSGHTIDLGEVPPRMAVDYLLNLVRKGRESVAEDAILPAVLARDVEVWPDLMKIARTRSRPDDVRESAVFWLGQIAGDKVTENLAKLVDDNDVDLQVREAAVFALSQQESRRSTRHLMNIAQTNDHPQLRRNAMFWLSQQDDPAVLDFFERVLLEN